jgi:hypothetical protein
MVTLQTVLRMNASTCLGFGILFAVLPSSVAQFLSPTDSAPNWVFVVLGVGLILQGVHLLSASFQTMPSKGLILYFSIGDFAWTLASLLLMIMGLWITSPLALIYATLVALMVGLLGLMQIKAYKNEYSPAGQPS